MRIVRVKLIKKATEDGLVEMRDQIPLGKEYDVDADSRQVVDCFNYEHVKWHQKEMVMAVTGSLPKEWLATELLEFPVDA